MSFAEKEAEYSQEHPVGGKLIAQSRGKPSSQHSFTSEVVFEHIYLHLVLSDYLAREELVHLNSSHMLLEHMCKMIRHMKPKLVYDLFEYDKDYASQEDIPFKRSM